MKKIAALIFKILGWEITNNYPKDVKKCVIVVGPHTSNWDFFYGRLAFVQYGIKSKTLIKSDLFFPPLGWILRALGGLPVDRSGKGNMTDQAVKLFNEAEELYMVFTPEGTRKYNPNWKKGFYHIAKKANVPIYICYMDYANKKGGFYGLFETTDNIEDDIQRIKDILKVYKGKYPEKGID